mgnify:CR=1 FL=1
MSDHAYKKVPPHPALTVQYHPAAAVRKWGDGWPGCKEVFNVSAATCCALREHTPDDVDFYLMARMERGERGRV